MNAKLQMTHLLRPGGTKLAEKALQEAYTGKGAKVLDIGCGTGDTLKYVAENCKADLFGIDVAEDMCRQASENVPQGRFLTGNAVHLPFESGVFSLVFMECVLTLLEDPATALKEALRVMKPGGILAVGSLTAEEPSEHLLQSGRLSIPAWTGFLEKNGCEVVWQQDITQDLIQFMADIIFCFDSLEAYEKHFREKGLSVFHCGVPAKGTGYQNYLIKRVT